MLGPVVESLGCLLSIASITCVTSYSRVPNKREG